MNKRYNQHFTMHDKNLIEEKYNLIKDTTMHRAVEIAGSVEEFNKNRAIYLDIATRQGDLVNTELSWPKTKNVYTLFDAHPIELVTAAGLMWIFMMRCYMPRRHMKLPYSNAQLMRRKFFFPSDVRGGETKQYIGVVVVSWIMDNIYNISRKIKRN